MFDHATATFRAGCISTVLALSIYCPLLSALIMCRAEFNLLSSSIICQQKLLTVVALSPVMCIIVGKFKPW